MRGILLIVVFFAAVAGVVTLGYRIAEQPGEVELRWFGQQITTSVGILILATFLIGVAVAVLLWLVRLLWRTPGAIGRALDGSRRKRGYRALTQGMVAVAAGDPTEARRWAEKADVLLDEPPLTLLLSAQAAQLNGDEQAARRYFEAMLERDETRFLGLRGLINQAMHEGDDAAALAHTRKAYELRPKTPWVLETLFDLSERQGELGTAQKAVKEAASRKQLSGPQARRKRAVLLLEQSHGDCEGSEAALKAARDAHKLAPDLVPASVRYAEQLIETGRRREAARMLERGWAAAPHPDLVAMYKRARPEKDRIGTLKALEKLVSAVPRHPESRLALAAAALDAGLWGEARRYLAPLVERPDGRPPGDRACQLMARLEETEHGDAERARAWLMTARDAEPAPVWSCGACNALVEAWSPRCAACNAFDSLVWVSPRRLPGRSPPPLPAVPAPPPPAVGQAPVTVAPEDAGEANDAGEAGDSTLPVPVTGNDRKELAASGR